MEQVRREAMAVPYDTMFVSTIARVVAVALLIGCTSSCNKSGEGTSTGRDRPDACITPGAEQVTHQPDFVETYTYCTTGSRAVPPPALIACLHDRSGLPAECASCYSWYKACVLRSCFNGAIPRVPSPTVCFVAATSAADNSTVAAGPVMSSRAYPSETVAAGMGGRT